MVLNNEQKIQQYEYKAFNKVKIIFKMEDYMVKQSSNRNFISTDKPRLGRPAGIKEVCSK